MILGYDISGPDNDSYMYEKYEGVETCGTCGVMFDLEDTNPYFILSNKNFDVSYTYDGYCIVSKRFKAFCEGQGYKGLTFHGFIKDEGFYHLIVENKVEFDAKRRKVRFEKYCKECERYFDVIGAAPVFLKDISNALDDKIYSTDIMFASGNEKSPSIIIGPETYKK